MSNFYKEIPKLIINNNLYNNTLSMLLMGIGLQNAIEKKKYHHIPLVVVFPSLYVGYHIANKYKYLE